MSQSAIKKAVWALIQQMREEEMEDCAVMLQSCYRGRLGRKRFQAVQQGQSVPPASGPTLWQDSPSVSENIDAANAIQQGVQQNLASSVIQRGVHAAVERDSIGLEN